MKKSLIFSTAGSQGDRVLELWREHMTKAWPVLSSCLNHTEVSSLAVLEALEYWKPLTGNAGGDILGK